MVSTIIEKHLLLQYTMQCFPQNLLVEGSCWNKLTGQVIKAVHVCAKQQIKTPMGLNVLYYVKFKKILFINFYMVDIYIQTIQQLQLI